MSDELAADLANRFNLGDRAGPLLAAVLGLITDSRTDGFAGFIQRLRRGGLGQQVSSWVGTGPNEPVTPEQIEQSLGADTVERVAARAGVPPGTSRTVLAFLIPKVVDLATPDGTVQAGVPPALAAFVGGAAGAGSAAVAGAHDAVRSAGAGIGSAAATGSSGLRKLVPAVLVLLLVFFGYRMLGRRTVAIEPGTTDTTAMASVEPAGGATGDSTAEPTNEAAPPAADTKVAVEGAMKKASAALAELPEGYTSAQLVDALNLNIINFASGTSDVPAESREILDQSARAIAGAPAGTVLEIGGHTDNTGQPAANEALSARRASAVREYLIRQGVSPGRLTAKGYGAEQPVAGNATEAGRFHNRRIEFTVVK
jgi:outer membrane protein OmpA-like peptidoglycan-associated protein/uncharacterized protein YidB (DUF937 family)